MSNIENYINFIVDDMMKNTIFDLDPLGIFFHPPYFDTDIAASFESGYGNHFPKFKEYVINRYGSKEPEVWAVWNIYSRLVTKRLSE